MMACTALMTQTAQPSYARLLRPNNVSPGVRQLQHWLETAWRTGYDKEGAAHFKRHIVGTRKWIGTADIWVVFSYLGIPAQLVDFRKNRNAPTALQEWVKKYFSEAENSRSAMTAFDLLNSSPVLIANKLPIILQHAGHSRTIVGYEQDKSGGVNLLLLDPAKTLSEEVRQKAISLLQPDLGTKIPRGITAGFVQKMMKRTVTGDIPPRVDEVVNEVPANNVQSVVVDEKSAGSLLSAVRVNLRNLSRKDEYQLLYFPLEAPLSEEQRMRRKVVTSDIGC
ncbi:hypothetical protein DACRYDRAFT_21478 [Dacryopinax primogenitus]|uniref:UFSP1/2/DUB catalytic domain-containing protein n=1 Tax=Dacryopinax primogenitus (strain DJM 731) TaxID=1858805 RepID=M5GB44_DACPD|nr:uncharacterized protein DACRYDRAFT_21478 [Dacryopinax primogenitus]EJU03222.1 hypothetical protein DACRYDRAFT_21478 [Dacryopinax primogenitus]